MKRSRVPERVAIVARAGQALGGNRALLGAGSRLKRVEEREAHGQLKLGVAVELDVRALPELVEVGALPGDESVPAGVALPAASAATTSSRKAGCERLLDHA